MTPQADNRLEVECAVVAASCPAANLRRVSRALTQMYSKALAPCKLQLPQFSLLVACALRGDTPISALADGMAMDRTTLARNLKPLERDGFVRVVAGEDRRVRV